MFKLRYLYLFTFITLALFKTSCSQTKSFYVPFNNIQKIEVRDLLKKDTLVSDVREFILMDTVLSKVLVNNYGINCDIQSKNDSLIIRQYVKRETPFYFSEYLITFSKKSYCLYINDNYIDYKGIKSLEHISTLKNEERIAEYFLGCLGESPEKYYSKFIKESGIRTSSFYNQLYYLGIINTPNRLNSPKLLKEKKNLNFCNDSLE